MTTVKSSVPNARRANETPLMTGWLSSSGEKYVAGMRAISAAA